MEMVIPGLHASPPEPVPFGPALEIRAYLLQREQGNVLVYRAARSGRTRPPSRSWAACRAST
jgi:hypothetical protein